MGNYLNPGNDMFYKMVHSEIDLSCDSLKWHIRRVNSVCHILHVTAADHKCMAVYLTIRRSFLKSVTY